MLAYVAKTEWDWSNYPAYITITFINGFNGKRYTRKYKSISSAKAAQTRFHNQVSKELTESQAGQ